MEHMTNVMIAFPNEVFTRTEEILKTNPLAAVRYSHRLFAEMQKHLAHHYFWSPNFSIRGEVFEGFDESGFGYRNDRHILYVDNTYTERWHALYGLKDKRPVITNTGNVYYFDLAFDLAS